MRYLILTIFIGLACTGVKEGEQYDGDVPTNSISDASNLYGPDNSWYHAESSEVPESDSCGFSLGEQACNFTMVDQFGDEVELYQFAGKYVVLDLFTEW